MSFTIIFTHFTKSCFHNMVITILNVYHQLPMTKKSTYIQQMYYMEP